MVDAGPKPMYEEKMRVPPPPPIRKVFTSVNINSLGLIYPRTMEILTTLYIKHFELPWKFLNFNRRIASLFSYVESVQSQSIKYFLSDYLSFYINKINVDLD